MWRRVVEKTGADNPGNCFDQSQSMVCLSHRRVLRFSSMRVTLSTFSLSHCPSTACIADREYCVFHINRGIRNASSKDFLTVTSENVLMNITKHVGLEISIRQCGDVTVLNLRGSSTTNDGESELLSQCLCDLVANGKRKLLLNLENLKRWIVPASALS